MKQFVVFYTDNWDGHEGTALYNGRSFNEVRDLFTNDFGSVATIDYIIEGE